MQLRIVMLRICHVILLNYAGFLSSVERLHSTFLQHLSDPANTTITATLLQVISKDSYFWEQIHHIITIFVAAVGSLLDISHLLDDLPQVKKFQGLLLEIRGICTEVERTTTSISNRLEGRLKFIEIGRSFHESSSVRLLSLLAVIFLPLSLASSLLSMSTRFADLHYLLYDFFGVIVLLGTVTITIVIVLKLLSRASEKVESKVTSDTGRKIVKQGIVFMVVVPWGLILASFLVGMIKDVGLGLRVLGYGAAGIVGLGAVAACTVGLMVFFGLILSF